MDLYEEWGFSENPFSTMPLESSEYGQKLLAGREDEMKNFIIRLFNAPSVVTIEGLHGIGKTSLINVALYKCYRDFYNQENNRLFIPCYRNFQITPAKDTEEFVDDVYIEVAQTLLRRAADLETLGYDLPYSISINKWLNSPIISSYQGTVGPIGIGFTKEFNSTKGFERSGFRYQIRNWLQEIFPDRVSGGVVCTIDNLEILGTPDRVTKVIEELRDTLFNVSGLRWIFCGISGLMNNIASSPRLNGLLHDPIEISRVNQFYAGQLYDNRMNYCSYAKNFYIPLTQNSFTLLFNKLSQNTRSTLKYANDFCIYAYSNNIDKNNDLKKDHVFTEWLKMTGI